MTIFISIFYNNFLKLFFDDSHHARQQLCGKRLFPLMMFETGNKGIFKLLIIINHVKVRAANTMPHESNVTHYR